MFVSLTVHLREAMLIRQITLGDHSQYLLTICGVSETFFIRFHLRVKWIQCEADVTFRDDLLVKKTYKRLSYDQLRR